MRILLTDIVFPNKYAKWRLTEIHSFMNKYDTDILIINRIDKYKNIDLNFDYIELEKQFNLKDYNILIFNPKYNYINKYNKNFNGLIYNNKIDSSYLIRHKKFGDIDFNINDYEKVYHIFLMNYYNFNKKFKFQFDKQFIHLYPGGGLINKDRLKNINKHTKLIPTQHFIKKYLDDLKNNCLKICVYGGPFFYKNENLKSKNYNKKELVVCFTSVGDIYEKGADKYVELVELFYKKYNNLNIKFISIGNCPINKYITHIKQMSQNILTEYYLNNVDILVNLDSGKSLNGFPLGVEGACVGCLLLTTDIHNVNKKNQFNFDSFLIINRNNLDEIVNKIKYLYDNKNILQEKSLGLQKQVYKLFNYETQMNTIFDFIEKH